MTGRSFFSGVIIGRSFVQWGYVLGILLHVGCLVDFFLAMASYLLSVVDTSHQSNRKKVCE